MNKHSKLLTALYTLGSLTAIVGWSTPAQAESETCGGEQVFFDGSCVDQLWMEPTLGSADPMLMILGDENRNVPWAPRANTGVVLLESSGPGLLDYVVVSQRYVSPFSLEPNRDGFAIDATYSVQVYWNGPDLVMHSVTNLPSVFSPTGWLVSDWQTITMDEEGYVDCGPDGCLDHAHVSHWPCSSKELNARYYARLACEQTLSARGGPLGIAGPNARTMRGSGAVADVAESLTGTAPEMIAAFCNNSESQYVIQTAVAPGCPGEPLDFIPGAPPVEETAERVGCNECTEMGTEFIVYLDQFIVEEVCTEWVYDPSGTPGDGGWCL